MPPASKGFCDQFVTSYFNEAAHGSHRIQNRNRSKVRCDQFVTSFLGVAVAPSTTTPITRSSRRVLRHFGGDVWSQTANYPAVNEQTPRANNTLQKAPPLLSKAELAEWLQVCSMYCFKGNRTTSLGG